MLELTGRRRSGNCSGVTRRDCLTVGSLSGLGLSLPWLLRHRKALADRGKPARNTSVVWLWLGGGPTHVETFDPKMTAPVEYRSVTGEVGTSLPGVTIGGTFPRIGKVLDKMAIVRSFAHRNSGHSGGTHWVMTGHDYRQADNGGLPVYPSLGSITARHRGASHPRTGAPTYVRMNGIYADGPAFLGPSFAPFDQNGQARRNMKLPLPKDRIVGRRSLLKQLDRINRRIDSSGLLEGFDRFEEQAFDLVFGTAADAFDWRKEDRKTIERYGRGLGEQLLTARRLCEAGVGFVTIHYGGWDMHGQIARAMKSRSPQVDQAVSAFVEDIYARGLDENILLVITGEFGRTPRVNRSAGRDHWAPLSALALSGGGLRMGQVVGESADKVDVPKTQPITPQDLAATVFHVLGVPQDIAFVNNAGRPIKIVSEGQPIPELA